MDKITPVLLSGGTGSRLWPLSRQNNPKQLLPLIGAETLLQQTARRVSSTSLFDRAMIMASIDQRFVIAEQVRSVGVKDVQIILEPVGRNTAPAIAVAALFASQHDSESILLVLPTDHSIARLDDFQRDLRIGLEAAGKGSFVLFGVNPSAPETGLGYIHLGRSLGKDAAVREVRGFKEKPDRPTAERFVRSREYAWNSGIFLLPARALLDELDRLEPELLRACKDAVSGATADRDFIRLDGDAFSKARSISLDHAILEKTRKAVVVPSSFAWLDMGTWSALWQRGSKDDCANVCAGDVVSRETANSYIRSEGPLVATLGVDNLVIVAAPDAVLVARKDRDQDVKALVDDIKAAGYCTTMQTVSVHRPWGFYRLLQVEEQFQVKHIRVDPGARLSLQKHRHRSEHWIIVRGSALVTRDHEQALLHESESAYVPSGCVHRLENPGTSPLDLIEVQTGAYLGEDDIIRLEDDYGRL